MSDTKTAHEKRTDDALFGLARYWVDNPNVRIFVAGRAKRLRDLIDELVDSTDSRPAEPGDANHPSAQDLGLRGGVDDSCVHGRSVWSCPQCEAGQLSDLVSLWGRDTAAAASCRRSVRMVWPELGQRLDDLLNQQDGGSETGGNGA